MLAVASVSNTLAKRLLNAHVHCIYSNAAKTKYSYEVSYRPPTTTTPSSSATATTGVVAALALVSAIHIVYGC